ncbi:hypothetical protein D9758_013282 [Tetrapyrgos nigripes]|uniref:F-box domain-containing protein n=1 Tax=Tetrapyrgos nigripes TaxID=182062 RepID=A0A8H5FPT5_9AGAR|nr:hypothetical protein D9758_013282 [Tetrapyrgos nigripes]
MHRQTSSLQPLLKTDKTIQFILGLLRANFGTYTTDVFCISQSLENAEHSCRELNVDVEKCQEMVLSKRIDLYRSLLAPIWKVPSDLLAHIFTFCCPENSFTRDKLDLPALHLSQVCAGWRDLSQSTPSLWSSISIHFSSTNDTHGEEYRVFGLLYDYLELSKDASLFITLAIWDTTQTAMLVLVSLTQHCAQWASFSLVCADFPLCILSEASINGNLPRLVSLRLLWYRLDDVTAIADAFSIAPNLQEVEIGTSFRFASHLEEPLQIPWAQITKLSHSQRDMAVVLRDLQIVSNATDVSVAFINDSHQSNPDSPTHLVHQLQTLTLIDHGHDYEEHPRWFQKLTLPRLTNLHFVWMEILSDGQNAADFLDIPVFLERSKCTITVLSLCNMQIEDVKAIELLERLPSLVEVKIHEHPSWKRCWMVTPCLLQ